MQKHKIPRDWYVVKSGHIRAGDHVFLADHSHAEVAGVFVGWHVGGFPIVIRKHVLHLRSRADPNKRIVVQIPEGYTRVRSGIIYEGDLFWHPASESFRPLALLVKANVKLFQCVIRPLVNLRRKVE